MSAADLQSQLDQANATIADLQCQLAATAAQHIPADRVFLPQIIAAVEQGVQISRGHLLGEQRDRQSCNARHMVILLASELTRLSLRELGRRLGLRDHSTVTSSLKRSAHLLDHDDLWRASYFSIRANLIGGHRG